MVSMLPFDYADMPYAPRARHTPRFSPSAFAASLMLFFADACCRRLPRAAATPLLMLYVHAAARHAAAFDDFRR